MGYILSNAKLVINDKRKQVKEININLTDFKIVNVANIPTNLKVKYLHEDVEIKDDAVCVGCGKPPLTHFKIGKQKIKVLSVWNDGGYYQINFKKKEEKKIFSNIIKMMRKEFFHGKYFCLDCQIGKQ